MECKNENEKNKETVTFFFDEKQENLDTKIAKIFESYLDRNILRNT